MRIIAGQAGRRKIKVPKAVVRPSMERVREAVFSMLSHSIGGAKVLDLFAGSGALGLESLSRGAESCVFVDENRECTNTIRSNLKLLRLNGGKVIQADVMRFLKRVSLSQYDVMFADPPYLNKGIMEQDFVAEMFGIESLIDLLADDGMLIVETGAEVKITMNEKWQLVDQRKYGGSAICFFQKRGLE